MILHTLKNIKIIFIAVLLIKSCVLRIILVVVFYRGENVVYKFIKAILKEYNYCKKVMKEKFNKNIIMSVEDEKKEFS